MTTTRSYRQDRARLLRRPQPGQVASTATTSTTNPAASQASAPEARSAARLNARFEPVELFASLKMLATECDGLEHPLAPGRHDLVLRFAADHAWFEVDVRLDTQRAITPGGAFVVTFQVASNPAIHLVPGARFVALTERRIGSGVIHDVRSSRPR